MNPFATRCIRPDCNIYRFDSDSERDESCRAALVEQLLSTLCSCRCAAIVGPHGTGKTTLLKTLVTELQSHFDRVVWLTLSSATRHRCREIWTTIDGGQKISTCLIVDGYEQLAWWERCRLIRGLGKRLHLSLIVTCHKRPRLIPTWHQTDWNEPLSRFLTAEKLATVPQAARLTLWSAFENHLKNTAETNLNLRDVWFAMYDEFELIRHQERQPS